MARTIGRNLFEGFVALAAIVVLAGLFVLPASRLMAQTTIYAGSIQGTITDPTGGVIPGAKVTITSKETARAINLVTSGSGTYSSGALIPGEYTVTIEAQGFKTVVLPVTVEVGVTAPGNVTLEVGATTTVVSVEATPVTVNTEQATVQGVLTAKQIDQLPIDGRNFLDLAALQPGVQIQDGGEFDPTKNGYSAVSVGGRQGRTTRIELDGVDITDETVGTTLQNVPMSAIQEFSVSQSSLDITTELTSMGAVNIVTRSGSNSFHGESFLLARSDHTSARYGLDRVPFDRQQYGVRFGGPFIKDKLFFFADWERTVQDLSQAVTMPAPFNVLNGSFNSPFHESMLVGRLDWQIKSNWRAYYRFTYDQSNAQSPYISDTFEPFSNLNHIPVQGAGLDVTQGSWSHAIRFGYTRFRNAIADAQDRFTPPGIPANVGIHIGSGTHCTGAGQDVYCSGPNILAPQMTLQRNLQFKYDGSKVYRSHVIRYGISVNRILGGGFAAFVALAPSIRSSFTAANEAIAAAGPYAGGASNPLNWPINRVGIGNGQGFFTEVPQFGFPGGGQYDTRFAWYIGDGWKAKRNLTINFGLRYVRDTGRSDSDLPAIPALDAFGQGLGNRVHQPNRNFAPQLGIAWDPWKNGKTVIRAGAGLYYENAVFNNILFDRPPRLQKGLFMAEAFPCDSTSFVFPDGTSIDTTATCSERIGEAIPEILAWRQQYQSQTAALGAQANGIYIGDLLASGGNSTGNGLIGPNYRTPFSWQFNVGFQRELKPGYVLTMDYVRNVSLHYLLNYDTNHVGDARYLNKTAAMNAINATNEGLGCADGPAGVDCAIAAGADIFSYADNGLDGGKQYLAGIPAFIYGLTPDEGAAFPGINPNLGENEMLFPIGRSVYNALQVQFRVNKTSPFRGVKNMGLLATYSLSRFKSMADDQDFVPAAQDYANTSHFFGPSALDRTHQIGFGGAFDFAKGFRWSLDARVATARPVTMTMPLQGEADIYLSDWYGDGSYQGHILPGTNVGSFGRDVKVSNLNNVIKSYNTTFAGSPTPAGQALIDAGFFTKSQLVALGGVMQPVPEAPAGQVANPPLLNASTRL
ncbi:MAG: TonB-dependent receptor, partial [Acidobacteriia bacterium]|nr:TonB-dependent receptor [Terriglobia bacterium]